MVWDHEVAGSNPATPTATPPGFSGVATTRTLNDSPSGHFTNSLGADVWVFLPYEHACAWHIPCKCNVCNVRRGGQCSMDAGSSSRSQFLSLTRRRVPVLPA